MSKNLKLLCSKNCSSFTQAFKFFYFSFTVFNDTPTS